ncbi:conserved hypothetical protein [Acidobacterium capsulatum ATCC 51196]|uniref:Antitoxin Xre-like helix-turn-helix domain-containing protein n=2 Tax=Acidobacteriaceae TaxID=204434 RepID=C1F6M6_ACIC5|nr:conserved hypothetical protein [Acidobacterium capsulatum ATCC 51196]
MPNNGIVYRARHTRRRGCSPARAAPPGVTWVMMIRENKPAASFHPAMHNDTTKAVARALGLCSMENISLMQAANSGLSWAAITRFLDCTGLSQQDLAHYLGIHARTFALRRKAGIFGKKESEQLLRLAELYQATLELFGGDTNSARA